MRDYIPDLVDFYNEYDAALQREYRKLPMCAYCGEPIIDEYLFDFEGTLCCESCADSRFKRATENYTD